MTTFNPNASYYTLSRTLNSDSLTKISGQKAIEAKIQRDIDLARGQGRTESALSSRPGAEDDQQLRQSCVDFEAVLNNMLFKAMRNTIPEGGLFGDGLQNDIYSSMFYQTLAQKSAGLESGVGVAALLYNELRDPETT